MAEYYLKMAGSEQKFAIDLYTVEESAFIVRFRGEDSDVLKITGADGEMKHPYLELLPGDAAQKNSGSDLPSPARTPPAKFRPYGLRLGNIYKIDFDSPQRIINSRATLMTTINDITFGVQRDRIQSANRNSESVRSLL